jgi:hypothetical protein
MMKKQIEEKKKFSNEPSCAKKCGNETSFQRWFAIDFFADVQ